MAKRNRTKDTETPISGRVSKHMEKLGLANPRDYLAWCLDHGFLASMDKGRDELESEVDAFLRDLKRADSRTKLHRNPKRFIEQACAGKISAVEITRPGWQEFARSIDASKADKTSRKLLCELLLTVHKKAGFLFESVTFGTHTYRYVDALIRLNDRRGQWISELEAWQPASHNRCIETTFFSLA